MHTRKDYLDGKCTHSEYYRQFVTNETKNIIITHIGLTKINAAMAWGNMHFINIPLSIWDGLTMMFRCNEQMIKVGDYPTLAGKVCILKETARVLYEEYN